MMETGYLITRKTPIIRKESDHLRTMIYYADGKGIEITHSCRNVTRFDHSLIDPSLPTGGYY